MKIHIRNINDIECFSVSSFLRNELKYDLTSVESQVLARELKRITTDLGRQHIGRRWDKHASSRYSTMYHNDLKPCALEILFRLRAK